MIRNTLALFALSMSFAMAADKVEKGFTSLFNGKDLTGWKISDANENTFSVKDGAIVAHGKRSHAFYDGPFNQHDFKNFELKVDVMTQPVSNGGIYFHTAYQDSGWPDKGFEVQVNNSFTKDPRKTGGLYMVQDNMNGVAEDGKWFTEHIIVKNNHVTVMVDGKKIVDWTQPADWAGPKNNPGRKLSGGTIALQGHDPGSTVMYKNIRIKILK